MVLKPTTIEAFKAIPYIMGGVGTTIKVTLGSLVVGTILGLVIALLRVYGGKLAQGFAVVYSRIIRSLPLLVIIFMLFFLGTEVIDFSAFEAVIIALAVHTSAYQAEAFRGAIGSIEKGQMEAAMALGMTKLQCIFTIILPQAARRAIPYWTNEASILLKDSSLAYVLGVTELMRRGDYVSSRANPLVTYIIVGMIYFILTFTFTRGMSLLEKKYSIPE